MTTEVVVAYLSPEEYPSMCTMELAALTIEEITIPLSSRKSRYEGISKTTSNWS